jgi:hypothetical protein
LPEGDDEEAAEAGAVLVMQDEVDEEEELESG